MSVTVILNRRNRGSLLRYSVRSSLAGNMSSIFLQNYVCHQRLCPSWCFQLYKDSPLILRGLFRTCCTAILNRSPSDFALIIIVCHIQPQKASPNHLRCRDARDPPEQHRALREAKRMRQTAVAAVPSIRRESNRVTCSSPSRVSVAVRPTQDQVVVRKSSAAPLHTAISKMRSMINPLRLQS